MSSKSSSSGGGIGRGGVVQIVLIVLKLTGLIKWSWWWVLSPTLASLAVVALFLLVLVGVGIYKGMK